MSNMVLLPLPPVVQQRVSKWRLVPLLRGVLLDWRVKFPTHRPFSCHSVASVSPGDLPALLVFEQIQSGSWKCNANVPVVIPLRRSSGKVSRNQPRPLVPMSFGRGRRNAALFNVYYKPPRDR